MSDKKRQINEVAEAMESLSWCPQPSLGIDIDGCVDEAPLFFRILTDCWPGKVFVVSYRSDRAKAEEFLTKYDITYDELILVSSFDAKAEVIVSRGISVFFDDQPEMLKNIPSQAKVMLVRNGGNFDFDDRKWMFSDQTGKMI